MPPWNAVRIGLMMLSVNALMSVLKASAITSATATVITSPRIKKFLKPLIIISSPSRPVPGRRFRRRTMLGRPGEDGQNPPAVECGDLPRRLLVH